MSRYLIGLAVAGGLVVNPLMTAQIFAGDGQIIIMREVPYQPVNGPRHTGQVHAIDPAPDAQVTAMTGSLSKSSGSGVTELTDRESAVIASGVQSNAATLSSGLQNTSAYEGITSGGVAGTLNSALAPTGALGSITSGIGGGVGGSISRATDALGSTLSGAMFRAGGMK